MKKIFAILLVVIFCFTVSGCFYDIFDDTSNEISRSKNVKVYSVQDANVWYYPQCPSCGHLNGACVVEMTAGEYQSGYAQCNSCGQIFEMEIRR